MIVDNFVTGPQKVKNPIFNAQPPGRSVACSRGVYFGGVKLDEKSLKYNTFETKYIILKYMDIYIGQNFLLKSQQQNTKHNRCNTTKLLCKISFNNVLFLFKKDQELVQFQYQYLHHNIPDEWVNQVWS